MAMMIPEFQYLQQLIRSRLNEYFPATAAGGGSATEGTGPASGASAGSANPDETIPAPLPLADWHLPMSKFIADNKLNAAEATLLLIGLAPHFQPDLFDQAIESKIPGSGNFPKLGGVRGKNSRSFLPTGETALFLLGGEDRQQRLDMQALFGVEHLFGQKKILWLEDIP